MAKMYSPQQLEFIQSNYQKMGIQHVTDKFNQEFHDNKTFNQIKAAISNHKFTCGRPKGQLNKGVSKIFTTEQENFLKENYGPLTRKELVIAFNNQFNTDYSYNRIVGYLKNNDIKSGRDTRFKKGQQAWNKNTKGLTSTNKTSFKKGHRPENTKPLGSERKNNDGYIEVKTAEPNTWQLKHRIIYQQEHGPIPPGHNIRFKDGNNQNLSIENLVLIDNREHALLNQRYHLNKQPQQHRETIILMAKIDVKTARIKEKMQ
ncbi:HNH endonuclease [Endozoicomonas sp. G2_1]|uniref:HNH endonuclease signature motif containing protein n=1 Tax=Endozoicomonas sp. G2_1 TaxID=2821091 RepID=UPI001ADB3126|nr:HNH endonuclease signature motif containing protein [Endozoicomonas sp. G2_1]MBO9492190.1 HNH endonuclease [Endozoicomonas sp. G2_1]